ncbi:pseudaminic acid cytidylyltransferase [Asticcacaulis sp. W401b]|uniref:pseudaminic acid cytidylyltransferase n=1 Tax=Asticcacaulis sp. W401b TaxID=3388666 RepID=UPI003970D991
MRRVCIIPARGGSKRIPRKNIKPFFGQPMIGYSIRAAVESGLFERIMVSTDDAEIAEVARACGAQTPFVRPPELANDHAGTGAVMAHALDWLITQGERPDALCCLYATAPFLTAKRLIEGWEALQGKRHAFSVTSYAFPIQRALYVTPEGGVAMFQPEHRMTRSQDLVPAYHDAAQFYWSWTEAALKGEDVFSIHSAPVILPRTEVVDIDTPEDWEVAEQMFAALRASEK